MLTQNRLKQLLHYDPDTGLFTWLVNRGKAKPGKIAGLACIKQTKHYVIIGVDGSIYRAHRLAFLYMTGDWPVDEVDHINGDGEDNRSGVIYVKWIDARIVKTCAFTVIIPAAYQVSVGAGKSLNGVRMSL